MFCTYSFSLVNTTLWISVGDVRKLASPPFPIVNVRIILQRSGKNHAIVTRKFLIGLEF